MARCAATPRAPEGCLHVRASTHHPVEGRRVVCLGRVPASELTGDERLGAWPRTPRADCAESGVRSCRHPSAGSGLLEPRREQGQGSTSQGGGEERTERREFAGRWKQQATPGQRKRTPGRAARCADGACLPARPAGQIGRAWVGLGCGEPPVINAAVKGLRPKEHCDQNCPLPAGLTSELSCPTGTIAPRVLPFPSAVSCSCPHTSVSVLHAVPTSWPFIFV